jgi:hypothetical protein
MSHPKDADIEFLKKAMMLKSRLDSDLKFEFVKYLEFIKMEHHAATTADNLKKQLRAAVRSLPEIPFKRSDV